MKKYLIIFIFLISTLISEAQFIVSINSNQFSDTVKTCRDTSITYYAYGIFDNDTIPDMHFRWDFENLDTTNVNLDTIEHSYFDQQAYRILVTVWNDTLWGYNVLPVQLGIKPWFSDTKSDVPDDQDGICLGEEVTLTGNTQQKKWKEERQTIKTEIPPQYIDNSNSYSEEITRRSFLVGDTIEQSSDFDSIAIKIEHSNTENVKITLTCPTGKTVVLKDTGGVEKAFGEPIIEVGNYSEGLGYWYYWTNAPNFGTMNTFVGADTLPSSTYTPDSLFSQFIGYPLDGTWTMTVIDDTEEDDGYIFAWALIFDKDIEKDTLEYFNIYNGRKAWNGNEISSTNQDNGVAYATPEEYGSHPYKFFILDDFGCPHDTSLTITVEEPIFEMDKTDMVIGDSVKLENITTWSENQSWKFGDFSDKGSEILEYKKYDYKGIYQIIMTVTSESGCKDRDTNIIEIEPKETVLIVKYNIFTPNGDGINDVFKFFNTPDEKIHAENIEDVIGRIYNRNGEIVCEWNSKEDILEGWDGTIKNRGGRDAPAGYYYYILIITNKNEESNGNFEKQKPPESGKIYLFRSK
jgi:gliding motility-associated-like protein